MATAVRDKKVSASDRGRFYVLDVDTFTCELSRTSGDVDVYQWSCEAFWLTKPMRGSAFSPTWGVVSNIERVPRGSGAPTIDGGFTGFCPLWMYRLTEDGLRGGYSRKQCGFSLDEEGAAVLLARMFPSNGTALVPEGFAALSIEGGRSVIVCDNRRADQIAPPPEPEPVREVAAPVRLEDGTWQHAACLVCGEPFVSKSRFSKYCCRDHKKYAYYHPEEFPHTDGAKSFGEAVCPECGKTFIKHTTMQMFCKPSCQKLYAARTRRKGASGRGEKRKEDGE